MGHRYELTDKQFSQIEHFLPGRSGYVRVTARNNRKFMDGVIWIFKTGAPFLPSFFISKRLKHISNS